MTIDFAHMHTASRTTGPLDATFSLVTHVVDNAPPRAVEVPGFLVNNQDSEFVSGVYWGRVAYWGDVDRDSVKVRDLTAADLVEFIRSTMLDVLPHELDESLEWKAGLILGYINAAQDAFTGQACSTCGARKAFCQHE